MPGGRSCLRPCGAELAPSIVPAGNVHRVPVTQSPNPPPLTDRRPPMAKIPSARVSPPRSLRAGASSGHAVRREPSRPAAPDDLPRRSGAINVAEEPAAVTVEPPIAKAYPQPIDTLIEEAGVPVPEHLLERHAEAMSALLRPGASSTRLPLLVSHAADSLQRVHHAFVSALPDGLAAASPACQEISSALLGEARLINHIHHTGTVPGHPDRFLALAAELPPSRLDRLPHRSWGPLARSAS